MNRVGNLVEDLRKRRGLSRGELARLLDVSAQTILNIERDPHYNLGTRLLRAIEIALGGEFHINFEEGKAMSRIRMGNDEFILNIRKNGVCALTNDQLGRRIWVWLRDNANGKQLVENQPCRWGSTGQFIDELDLPKTATQFEFDITALPDLYRFLTNFFVAQPAGTTP